jgi:UDP-glucose 4-epimerase
VLSLLEHGARVTLIDNLSNSFMRVLDHMKKLAGDKASLMTFVKVCLLTREFKLVAADRTAA